MRIAFDGTTLTPGRTGVGYYTEHLLQHLAREVESTGDELVVISNQPVDTQVPLPPHVRVHAGHRFPIRIGWMQLRAARALEALAPDVAHFTNGMVPAGTRGLDGGDHPRHEPAAVSAVPPGAPPAAQSPADARRDPARVGDRHGLAQHAARSAAAPRPGPGARVGRA